MPRQKWFGVANPTGSRASTKRTLNQFVKKLLIDGRLPTVRQMEKFAGFKGIEVGEHLLDRRGLPVCDARLLVNLVYSAEDTTFIDPFAGVGGVIQEASENGYLVMSCDRDSALRYGLKAMSRLHCVADAARLPIGNGTISAMSTEPPYHPEADTTVVSSLKEMQRVLKKRGRVSILCASRQAEGIRQTASSLGLETKLDSRIDRKNLECVILVFENT